MIYSQTLISVIIPIYNADTTLDECIRSVVEQEYDNWELILVDDGSKDNSGRICDTWAENDSRIMVIHQQNGGRSVARCKGVTRARGEWCSFIDADDKIPQNALSSLAKKATDDTDIVFGNGYTINSRGKVDIVTFRHLAVRGEGTIGVPWGTLFRRKLLTPYVFDVPRSFYMGEDYIFWLRIIFKTSKDVAVVYENVYTKNADTTSSSFVWTSNYAALIHAYRIDAIPHEKRGEFLTDTIADRIANLFAVTLFEKRSEWRTSKFYRQLREDMETTSIHFTIKQKIFLYLLSRKLKRIFSAVSNWRRS